MQGRYADVNGLSLYYETRGTGWPLVVLHGGLGAIEMFGPSLPLLATGRQVVAVDLQGHGRTADIDRPLDVEFLADDIAALAEHLGNDRLDIMGYSLGGLVALQTAIRHHDLVRKLVVVSTPFRRSGVYAERLVQADPAPVIAESLKQTPVYQLYSALAPNLDDWPVLVTKLFASMAKEFDYSEGVTHMKAATLIACADADIFPPSHAAEFFGLLGGGLRDPGWDGARRPMARLAVLPGLTHYTICNAPALLTAVVEFLDDPLTG